MGGTVILGVVGARLRTGAGMEGEVSVVVVMEVEVRVVEGGAVDSVSLLIVAGVTWDSVVVEGLTGVGGVVRGWEMGVVAAGVVDGVGTGVEVAGVEGAGREELGVEGAVDMLAVFRVSRERPVRIPDAVARAGPLGLLTTLALSSCNTKLSLVSYT